MTDRRAVRLLAAAALGVVLLKGLPAVATRVTAAPDGETLLPTPYVPKDWLAYVALVEEPWAGEGWFLANPFTTEVQDGRIIILPLQVLNVLHHATGWSGFALLEAARALAIAGFAAALWWFAGLIHPRPVRRLAAAMLVLLSGGFDVLAYGLAARLPATLEAAVRRSLRPNMGWSTFNALFNPLWAVGLALLLVVVGLAWKGGGRRPAVLGLAAAGLWLCHPYSAIAAAAALAGGLALAWLLEGAPPWRGRWPAVAALGGAAAVAAGLARWQLGDPVFARTSGGVFGAQGAPVAWWPIALGVTLLLAVRGLHLLSVERNPWRHLLAGWIAAVGLLHSSDWLNGYHFIPFVHLPVALAAAPALEELLERLRTRSAAARAAWVAGLAALLVGPTLALSAWDTAAVKGHGMPADLVAAVQAGRELPPGRFLATMAAGALVPAFGPHRVYVGHWFMTPDSGRRQVEVDRLLGDPVGQAAALRALVAEERIDYVLLPADRVPALAEALPGAIHGSARFGRWAIALVRRG